MVRSDKEKKWSLPETPVTTLDKWPPLLFIIKLMQSIREFVTETIRSRKWLFKYQVTKTRYRKEVHIEIRYNYQSNDEGY